MAICNDPTMQAMLHAYELGILSEEETERFELHLMSCEHCRIMVAEFEDHAAILRHSDKIREVAGRASETGPKTAPGFAGIWRLLWPAAPLPLKPGLIYLILLLVAMPAVIGVRQMIETPDSARPIQLIRLVPTRASQTGTFQIATGLDGVISFGIPDAVTGKSYDVTVTGDDGQQVYNDQRFTDFDEYGFGNVVVPAGSMRTGNYRLVVTDPEVSGDSVIAEYRFSIAE